MRTSIHFPEKGILPFLLLITSMLVLSCKKESPDMFDCNGVTPTYTADIKPILDASCAKSGCHDATTAEQGVNLSTYASASAIS